MKIKGLFRLNEIERIYIPKIKNNEIRNEDIKIPIHQ